MIKSIFKASIILVLIIFFPIQNTVSSSQKHSAQSFPQIKSQANLENLSMQPDHGKIPLYFIPNEGQVNEKALFYAKTSKYTLWLTKEGLVFDSTIEQDKQDRRDKARHYSESRSHGVTDSRASELTNSPMYEKDVSQLYFLNANKKLEVVPVEVTEHRVNYFIGNDETKWKADIKTSKAVLYKGLYKHIDLRIYGDEGQIEYDWIVKPGGEVSDIQFFYQNVEGTGIEKNGNLVVKTAFGEMQHVIPQCYQIIEGKKIVVEASFEEISKNTFGFKVGKYNKRFGLIIDPKVLVYSTYLGGNRDEFVSDVVIDSEGSAYIFGDTLSDNFPTKKAIYSSNSGDRDVYVVKFAPGGDSLVYSTYLGGSIYDFSGEMAIDSEGAVYVTGTTYSKDFPIKKAYTKNLRWPSDAFVTKIEPGGNALAYSTYLGGSGYDDGWGIAVDSKKSTYVTGYTHSNDFPTKNPIYNSISGYSDVFVTKISLKGKPLIYSTYLGGSHHDMGWSIAVDSKGAAYVVGHTKSTNFPTKKPIQDRNRGYYDVFLFKINPDGDALSYSTYLGGSKYDYGYKIVLDQNGAAYITGRTKSNNFPVKNAFQKNYKGMWEAYVAKISPKGNTLSYSSYLGGELDDIGYGITVNSKGQAFVVGSTRSSDFPTKKALHSNHFGLYDCFISKIYKNGKRILFSTFFGGSHYDHGMGIALGSDNSIYFAGSTRSDDFPVKNARQSKKRNGLDVFVAKIR